MHTSRTYGVFLKTEKRIVYLEQINRPGMGFNTINPPVDTFVSLPTVAKNLHAEVLYGVPQVKLSDQVDAGACHAPSGQEQDVHHPG